MWLQVHEQCLIWSFSSICNPSSEADPWWWEFRLGHPADGLNFNVPAISPPLVLVPWCKWLVGWVEWNWLCLAWRWNACECGCNCVWCKCWWTEVSGWQRRNWSGTSRTPTTSIASRSSASSALRSHCPEVINTLYSNSLTTVSLTVNSLRAQSYLQNCRLNKLKSHPWLN